MDVGGRLTCALVLVDLQEDFLAHPRLEPHRGRIVHEAATLLAAARSSGAIVVHILTSVRREPDERMRHWKASDLWMCVEGTPGREPPEILRPAPGEIVLTKTGFGVGRDRLGAVLAEQGGCDLAIVAGVHTHACVRQAALDFHEMGSEVWIAGDAVGSHEHWHAAHTELFLRRRTIPFVPSPAILRRLSHQRGPSAADERSRAVTQTRVGTDISNVIRAARCGAGPSTQRLDALRIAAARIDAESERLADEIVGEIGKPVRYARAEVERTSALLRAVADELSDAGRAEARVRHSPLGTVAVLTPWTDPLAVPAGQIAPALASGNTVIWKPSPAGLETARNFHRILVEAGISADQLTLLSGDAQTCLDLVGHPDVDGVCFTGSKANGRVVAALCAERQAPLRAELGGDNAAIVTADADLRQAARLLAEAAFGSAGQRCMAIRRVIVLTEVHDIFVALLTEATAELHWGDPSLAATQVGPLISPEQASRVWSCVERARAAQHRVAWPRLGTATAEQPHDAYYPPALVFCDDPDAEIVREETLGPVLVIQRASDWEAALSLVNGVGEGLAASLFSACATRQEQFLHGARAKILKINLATVEAGTDVPVGGLRQHDFFTRTRTIHVAMPQHTTDG